MARVALVTGGTRGIGAAISVALKDAGYNVAANYAGNDEAANAFKAKTGIPVYKWSVADYDECVAGVAKVEADLGPVDVLVNNAGITRDGLLVMLREDDWDRVQGVNLTGPFLTTRACVPLMEEAGGGHIVNISSRSGTKGKAGQAAYSASKAGLVGLTFTVARELGPRNIRVNAVLPGYMPTDMGTSAEKAMTQAREHSALGRLADPVETASFIAWLTGTAGITGRVFDLDSRQENTPY